MDGVLYCKPHFEQLFKESGNYSKNFQAGKTEKPNDHLTRTPSKLSSFTRLASGAHTVVVL
jgi:cysteine/glycine-rich protein